MPVTIKDIASHAGVSTATVSNVLTQKKHVSAALEQRVFHAIRSLGYRPNVYARILKTSRSYIIGVHVPDISNPFFGEAVKGIQGVATKAGYQVILYESDNDIQSEARNYQAMLDANLEGIIAVAPRSNIDDLVNTADIPLVVVDHPPTETKRNVAFVYSDNYRGAAAIADYLLNKGHRRFICLAGPTEIVPNAKSRLTGFLDTVREHSLPDASCEVVYGDFTFNSGYELMKDMLRDYEPLPAPAVAVVGSDIMAWGAMEAIKDKKWKIPRDIGVVGYDNISFSSYLYPKLTTVENPITQMAVNSMKLMLDALEQNRKLLGVSLALRSSLIVRKSC